MRVTDKLKRLTGETDKLPKLQSSNETINELRRKIDTVIERSRRIEERHSASFKGKAQPLESVITGEEIVNEHGTFYFTRSTFHESSSHGCRMVGDLADIDMRAAGLIAGSSEIALMNPADGLYLDTETTGLAGGTGTFPFLIGLGWFEDKNFVTSQLFARDFPEEKAMLNFLQEIAAQKQFLVTFNGKAYDINLLSTRFILNRLEDPFINMPHLDLLFICRRLFRHRLENSRLVTLECGILGFERTGDVPGYEIPQRYFDWLKRRDARALEDIFEHNRLDILSMAALNAHLTELVGTGTNPPDTHPGDIMAVARLFFEYGDSVLATKLYEELIHCEYTEVAKETRRQLSLIHKRAECWEDAARLWEIMLADNPLDLFAVEELAKFLEHKKHDYTRAIELIEVILDRPVAVAPFEHDALIYRMERLKRKSGLHLTDNGDNENPE
ncbi:MAG: ribonuclease H-like domain-containing protein [Deltaproteobacteria bacterium]|nr:ribonuclease H-like domain-containing protein [Deltaproteobacteria bacterium]